MLSVSTVVPESAVVPEPEVVPGAAVLPESAVVPVSAVVPGSTVASDWQHETIGLGYVSTFKNNNTVVLMEHIYKYCSQIVKVPLS